MFKIKNYDNRLIEDMYNKAMNELGEFFGVNWTRNQPRIYIVKDRGAASKWWGRESTSSGWINGSDIYILDRSTLNKYRLQKYPNSKKYSNREYFMLIKHELAHVFTRLSINFFNGQQLSPDWLWEGIAEYLSGINIYKKKPEKFKKFLKYEDKNIGDLGVYEESGYAVEFLVEKYGKEKLLELIKYFREPYSRVTFEKRFKKVYGFELNYKNFNK